MRVIQHGRNREVEDRYRVLFPDLVFDEGGVEGFLRRLPADAGSSRTPRAARTARTTRARR